MFWILLLAQALAHNCQIFEGDYTPPFDPQITINQKHNHITWKGRTFEPTMGEFTFVQLLLTAPEEVIAWDDLIIRYYGRLEDHMKDARTALRNVAKLTRHRFRLYDPDFDLIKNKHAYGMYWVRTNPEHVQTLTRGQVKVALHFQDAWVNGEHIALKVGEHLLLLQALKVKRTLSKAAISGMSESSVPVHMCHLNEKFAEVTGERVLICQDRQLKLNPSLVADVSPMPTPALRN